jgi:EmrB/QacA subfamily drug resistance transporter
MYELAAFRAVQGLGAGGLMSLALAIMGDIVPPRQRARYQGYFLAVFATASVVGPVIGGLLAGAGKIGPIAGWRWIFYINVPIGLVALVVVNRVLHIPHQRHEHRIDWPGALALVVCLVPLLTVAEQGRTWGWGSGRSLACYLLGAVGLVAFMLAERAYGDEALLPLRLFRVRTFAVASGSSLLLGMGMFGTILVLPLYLQIVKDYSPTAAGLAMVPLVVGIMLGSVISGQAISRTGRYPIFPIVGTALMAVALLLFSLIGADTPLWKTLLIMPLMGLGLGGNMQPIILATQNAVSPREIGVATSSVTFFRQMGGTLGTAVFLSVLFTALPGRIREAITAASGTPEFQQALREHPDQAALLRSVGTGNVALDDTSFISRLAAPIAHPFKVGFSDSMSLVFLLGAGVMVIGFLVVRMLPELPLADRSAAQARAAELGAEADAVVPAAPAASATALAAPPAATEARVAPAGTPRGRAAGLTGRPRQARRRRRRHGRGSADRRRPWTGDDGRRAAAGAAGRARTADPPGPAGLRGRRRATSRP